MCNRCGNCAYADACLLMYHANYSQKETLLESEKDFVSEKACHEFEPKKEC